MINHRGVTLILAVLISSIALALGIGISTLILGEIGISRTLKESVVAFYAADSGAECALYWDIKNGVFSTSDPPSSINCAGGGRVVTFDSSSSLFTFDMPLSGIKGCAHVRVQKIGSETTVTSLGENIDCGASSERSVQRGLEVTY